MSHGRMSDIKVDDVVGRNRKPVDGVMDIDSKKIEGGYMDEGKIQKPTSELYNKDHRRNACG